MGQSNESVLVETLGPMDEIRVNGRWHVVNNVYRDDKNRTVRVDCTEGKNSKTTKIITYSMGTEIAKMTYYPY